MVCILLLFLSQYAQVLASSTTEEDNKMYLPSPSLGVKAYIGDKEKGKLMK
ncbi:hypothetical protein HMPREF0083_00204 [Aneurinibacillus aneurinilyticus ATCC 12856]|uniref:Uncharacterized protein n=1 Tax=Aneurinibacillus aneurinilyticus ATCC 12856 TaxID=649747 RepID=U1WST5_ANEAE|nr:hypothetical protein HMPREF0083_00204 [Aneurinibacillus aneurinilyticus ATCC 12856]